MQAEELAKVIFRPQTTKYELTPEQSESIAAKQQVFNRISASVTLETAKTAAHDYSSKQPRDSSLTYGEVEFASLGEIFESIKSRYGGISRGIFYDLGSGSGKAVLSAAILHPFAECRGIELVPGLYELSLQLKDAFDRFFPTEQAANPPLFPSQPVVSFTLGSFFEVNWSDASFFFANSTCFSRAMMDRISELPVEVGTFAVTLTKPLTGYKWRLLESYKKEMSWGPATVFVQRRVNPEEQRRIGAEIESFF